MLSEHFMPQVSCNTPAGYTLHPTPSAFSSTIQRFKILFAASVRSYSLVLLLFRKIENTELELLVYNPLS